MFRRSESFQDFIRFYPIVSFLVGLHFFLWLTTDFLMLSPFVALENSAELNNYYVANGEYWRLVTPIFFHYGFGHALFNSFSLVLFGPALEQMLGKPKFIFAYLATGIIGNLGSFFFGPMHVVSVGASGAIFGLFGIYLYMIYARRELIDQANTQIILTISVIALVMTFLRSNINIYGHIFGLVGGLVVAPLVLRNAQPFSQWRNVRRSRKGSDGDITFDPNRWKKRRFPMKKFLPKLLWGILILLVVFGLISRFL
ncbi:rhomboid family intramembrane serine protease [Pontibacillus marinus]|uniref:S54 family peptidase n=1 Tax=Pontibacillus marinus BH030004 = DSM 16465 TaxID=1385511 RepID=A0A0A5G9I3_9BACI|nr:rhomboid family intramembrane serine protease [Pontibacillus marinus]KGX87838.1 S54 family peptidase [Pontibacillus marinus BH030004 = DSM 16465]